MFFEVREKGLIELSSMAAAVAGGGPRGADFMAFRRASRSASYLAMVLACTFSRIHRFQWENISRLKVVSFVHCCRSAVSNTRI